MELKERILKEADDQFCKFGIKRITMDDIAREVGISKKTIYQHFKDKNDLVYVLIHEMLEMNRKEMDINTAKASTAIEEAFLIVTHLQQMLSKTNPMMFYDLHKYHPEVWALFKNFRFSYMKDCILKNINWGKTDGYFRKGINAEIIALLRLEQVDMIFNQIVFAAGQFVMLDVMREVTDHYLYGLSTLKGHKLINKCKQITEE